MMSFLWKLTISKIKGWIIKMMEAYICRCVVLLQKSLLWVFQITCKVSLFLLGERWSRRETLYKTSNSLAERGVRSQNRNRGANAICSSYYIIARVYQMLTSTCLFKGHFFLSFANICILNENFLYVQRWTLNMEELLRSKTRDTNIHYLCI